MAEILPGLDHAGLHASRAFPMALGFVTLVPLVLAQSWELGALTEDGCLAK